LVTIDVGRGRQALVDERDYPEVSKKAWHLSGSRDSYARHSYRQGKRVFGIFMHTLIMQPPNGYSVDHVDGNGLNNTRSNLRLVFQKTNVALAAIRRGTKISVCGRCGIAITYEEITRVEIAKAYCGMDGVDLCVPCMKRFLEWLKQDASL
jgi:hypothetical protein